MYISFLQHAVFVFNKMALEKQKMGLIANLLCIIAKLEYVLYVQIEHARPICMRVGYT